MVHLKGETLNQLFSVLEEWDKNLKGCFKESTTLVLPSESPSESFQICNMYVLTHVMIFWS